LIVAAKKLPAKTRAGIRESARLASAVMVAAYYGVTVEDVQSVLASKPDAAEQEARKARSAAK
jgi:hypothetical protein